MISKENAAGTGDPVIASLIQRAMAGAGAAAAELGDRYREGNGIAPNEELTLHWYAVGARLGDAEAQNNYGSMLLNGAGCPADEAAAVPWYRASAEQGNAVAQYNLGIRYLHGSGVEADDRTAFEWLARSANQGYVDAIGELGTLYRFGRGTARDLLAAARLHVAAAEQGDCTSQGNLSDYHEELVAMAIDGNREAAFDLMRMYQSGLGVARDLALCWAWIHRAHDLYKARVGTEGNDDELDADIAEAFRFFRAALAPAVRKRGEARLRELVPATPKPLRLARKTGIEQGEKR